MIDSKQIRLERTHEGKGDKPVPLSFPSFLLKRVLVGVALILLLIFFVLPIGKLIVLSMQDTAGPTLTHYSEMLQQSRLWKTLNDTFVIVAGSSLVSIALGVLAAWLMAYSDIKHKKTLHMAMLLSFILPSYVLTLSWSSFMGSQGLAAGLLHLVNPDAKPWSMYSYGGIIFVMGIHHFPLVYLLTVDVLRKIPRDLEWATRASGAGRWKTFRLVTLPLALPGLTAGGLLAFLASLDNFGIPAFLGIPKQISVLSTLIYEEIIGFGPSAFSRGAALSVMLGVIAIIGTLLQWLAVRKIKAADTVIVDNSPRFALGKHRTWVTAAIWAFLAVITVVPLVSMIALSLKKAYGLPFQPANLTLSNYKYILLENEKVWQSIQNSLTLSATTLVICLVFGSLLAYVRVRKPSWLTKSSELAVALPYTLPGIVFGLTMIFAWMQPIPGWNPGIYGSIRILFIAYVCRFMILQVRAGITAFTQIDPSMEEAAHIFGAGFWKKWAFVLLPLLLPGLLSGAFLVFLTAFTELTVSALLWSTGSQTIGVTIFGFEQAGNTLYSTALSSLIVLLIMVGMGLLHLIRKFSAQKGVQSS
ncbi:iron(III) transport system permease protein [Paenibacillus tianmuensis]|uniref:Iron(III) transport system permease protein n=1 Tax=Paenibacillus tianmuensis TaxID=624147 RepID=A0A1G4R1C2_9BACL|nr:iron ABC transporter permease [Paenibacillus tianmuensis]SCW50646.1 iron(III) transport system permease protein [Paenibacillus tianmuensis]